MAQSDYRSDYGTEMALAALVDISYLNMCKVIAPFSFIPDLSISVDIGIVDG